MLTFITYLFFAIMIYVAWTVLRFMFGIWRQTRNFRNTFHQFTNAANNTEQASSGKRNKKFAKTDGEYVDFEEVTDAQSQPSQHHDAADAAADAAADVADAAADAARESQISDAEYEEIK